MDLDEFYFLQQPEVQEILAKSAGMDPSKLALQLQRSGLPAAAVASQLKYRERGKDKVPSWVSAGCLFQQKAFEQCTSEELALIKPWGSGENALDLTCGMGVDAWAMAKCFEEVTTLEPDRLRFVLARHNLGMLGAENVSVWQSDAHSWLQSNPTGTYDLIYVDPDRRDDAGGRHFRLEDCSPDILAIQDRLIAMGRRVIIKTSPMLDIDAALKQLHKVYRVTVLAVDGECKELLFELRADAGDTDEPLRGVRFLKRGKLHEWEGESSEDVGERAPSVSPEYIYEADISVYKAQVTAPWFAFQYSDSGQLVHPDGYFFSTEEISGFPGRAFRVIEALPFKPAGIKKYLKEKGVKQVNLSRRYFDLPFDQVRQQLGVAEGGNDYLLLTRIWDGKQWQRMCYHAARFD